VGERVVRVRFGNVKSRVGEMHLPPGLGPQRKHWLALRFDRCGSPHADGEDQFGREDLQRGRFALESLDHVLDPGEPFFVVIGLHHDYASIAS
jgi:hypothetical protein